jgi:ABC-type uncharacterized transport system permease subunit
LDASTAKTGTQHLIKIFIFFIEKTITGNKLKLVSENSKKFLLRKTITGNKLKLVSENSKNFY